MDNQRMGKIVSWLEHSNIVMKLEEREVSHGFYVTRGVTVRFENGEMMDALDWLKHEGFMNGMEVRGYRVSHTPQGGDYGERIAFFPCRIYCVPFIHPDREEPEFPETDDDVPF